MHIYIFDIYKPTYFKIIEVYKSLIWTERFDAYGDFEIYMDVNQDIISFIRRDLAVKIPSSDKTMLIESYRIVNDLEDGDKLLISGRSLESVLDRRVVYPRPVIAHKDERRNMYESQDIQNVFQDILNRNIISPLDSNRQIPNFYFVRNNDLSSIPISVLLDDDSLYDIVHDLCSAYKIGFKVYLENSGSNSYDIKFKLYDGYLRRNVIFTPSYDNFLNAEYSENYMDYKNVTLVGGSDSTDENENKVYVSTWYDKAHVESPSGFERREVYTDASSVPRQLDDGLVHPPEWYTNLLEEKGIEHLEELKIDKDFNSEMNPGYLFKYGVDYNLGDKVYVKDLYGHKEIATISEFTISEDDSGSKAYPTFIIDEE